MDLENAQRILVCLRYGIGDVVMETPVLTALRSAVPGAQITAVGAAPATDLLDGDPRIDDVVRIARWGITHRWDAGTARSRAEIADWLDERRFDLSLDVHHAAAALGHAIWNRCIYSLEADETAEMQAIAGGADGVAAIKAGVRSGWRLDVDDDLAPRLHLQPIDRRFAKLYFEERGLGGPAPVGLSPVASLPMKQWPLDRLAAVADWIVEATGRRPILFCGPQPDPCDEVVRAMRRADRVLRVGSLHLRRVAALIARCALFLCNDTGLMHIAAAVGTPVIAIFGPSSPGIYLPRAPHVLGLVGEEIVCPHRNTASLQPPGCWNSSRCLIADRSCVWRVPTDRVIAEVRRRLEAEAEAPQRPSAVAS